MQDLQRINIKFHTPIPAGLALEPIIKVLDGWKDEAGHWLDIADYIHMDHGPGVMLYGKICFVSFDKTDGEAGILYQQRHGLTGELPQRFEQAFIEALNYAKRMSSDPNYPPEIAKSTSLIDVYVNDRYRVPNTEASEQALKPVIEELLNRVLADNQPALERLTQLNAPFGYRVKLSKELSLV